MLVYLSLSFLLTVCLIYFLSPLAYRINLLDYPGGRKKHERAVPLIGGICIFLSLSLILLPIIAHNQVYQAFWIAALSIIVIGALDDKHSLPAHSRFIAQFIAAVIICVLGHARVLDLGNLWGFGQIHLNPWLSIPFTCFAIMGVVNAVNMIDGLDGLTASISLTEFFLLFGLIYAKGINHESLLILVLTGALAAFLLFNFPSRFSAKHKIFLGDAGSMLLGFSLAWLAIKLSSNNGYPAALMLWIIAVPLMDTTHLIMDRYMRGVSPFQADRRHLHHIVLRLGFNPRQTDLIISTISLSIGSFGIYLYHLKTPDWLLFYGFIFLFFIYSWISYKLKCYLLKRD